MKVGDLVRMKTHNTGLVGIVMGTYPKHTDTGLIQIGIKWLSSPGRSLVAGSSQWEPESWLEVVSEAG